MVLPDSRIEMGAPVAWGAMACTWLEKAASARGLLLVSRGKTWMRAVPSLATQSARRSAGMDWMVTGCAFSMSETWPSMVFMPGTVASWARRRAGWPAFANVSRLAARRRASRAGLSWACPAASRNLAAVARIAATFSASVGGGCTSKGLMVASSRLPASAIIASFLSWSDGMKLDRVMVWLTSGSRPMRSASASATARVMAGTSTVLGEVSGFFIRSNRVATDSTLGLRRFRGLESKRTKNIRPSDTRPATPAT